MKKVLFCALSACLLASCSSDDSNTINNGNNTGGLAGTWKMTAFTVSTPVDLNGDGTATNDIIGETGCYDGSLIIFSSNGSVTLKSEEAGFDVDSGVITCERQPTQNGTYTTEGNNVGITVGGESFSFTRSGGSITGTEDTEFGQATVVFSRQ